MTATVATGGAVMVRQQGLRARALAAALAVGLATACSSSADTGAGGRAPSDHASSAASAAATAPTSASAADAAGAPGTRTGAGETTDPGDPGEASGPDGVESSPSRPPTTSPSSDPGSTPAQPAPATSRWDAAMLTEDDVPDDWERVDESDRDDDGGQGGGGQPEVTVCNEADLAEGIDFRDAGEPAGVVFRAAVWGPYATSFAATLPAGQAQELLGRLDRASRACRTWTQVDDDGQETVFTIEVADGEALGDQDVTFFLTVQRGLLTFETDLALWRHGDVMGGIVHAGAAGAVDRELTTSFARVVSRRLAALAA